MKYLTKIVIGMTMVLTMVIVIFNHHIGISEALLMIFCIAGIIYDAYISIVTSDMNKLYDKITQIEKIESRISAIEMQINIGRRM